MKLAFAFTCLASLHLAVAQDFHWRLYNNGGCDHGSPAAATFPPIPAPARDGTKAKCVNTPQGIQWNKLEVDTSCESLAFSLAISLSSQHCQIVDIFTFCHIGCTGSSLESVGASCASVPSGLLSRREVSTLPTYIA
ncbi:hypothetical protein B0H13DRAFT_1898950 [Mycena leptocephala]|nr:hypothetical protein B0H13DRAFT_1898950 [Mycena leptocephala]